MKNIYPLFCLFLSMVFTSQHTLAQTHVATATKYTSSSTSTISQAFPAPGTTGNLIVVHLSWDNQTRSVSTVTDNKGNTYARINGPTNWHTNYRSELWYAYNITGGGSAINITATLSGASSGFFQIYMSEYSGIAITNPLDQKSAAAGSGSAVSSGSKTTLAPNELIYGVSIGASGNLTVGATFTARSTANQNIVEDKKGVTAGSYNATFTSAGGNWVAEMATFKTLVSLPVEWVKFDAKATNQSTVQLDWSTATEVNNDHFEVQHSRDGSDWSVISKVKGSVNSNTVVHYSAIDSKPYPGLSYYRLVQFDLDGKATISEVVSAHIDPQQEKAIKVYPNPANSYLTLEGNVDDLQGITVFNSIGQSMNDQLRIYKENDSKVTLTLSALPKGMYFLKTKNKTSPFYKQ